MHQDWILTFSACIVSFIVVHQQNVSSDKIRFIFSFFFIEHLKHQQRFIFNCIWLSISVYSILTRIEIFENWGKKCTRVLKISYKKNIGNYYRKFSLERNSVWKEDTNWVGNGDSNIEIQSYFRIGRRLILKRKYKSICNSIFILENVW